MPSRQRIYESGMAMAIDLALTAQREGQRPFGCAIFDPAWNLIGMGRGSETKTDPTAHSEMDAIRMACKAHNGTLEGCTLVSTHEPCSMCSGAICHAKISVVVWGSNRADLPMLFRRLDTPAAIRLSDTSHPCETYPGIKRAECIALFDDEVEATLGPPIVYERNRVRDLR